MPPIVFFLLVYLSAFFAGAFGSLLGLGGGIIIIPVLTLIFRLDIHYAIGASIVSVIATSSGAAATYVKERLADIRLAMFLEAATTTGAIIGAFVAGFLAGRVLFLVFAVVLIYSSAMMFRKRFLPEPPPAEPDALSRRLHLSGRYYDPAVGQTIAYNVTAVPLGFGLAMIAGGVSGLLGIGGGALKVPAMDLFMRVPLKVSTATSNLMIGVTAATSAGVYFVRGDINPFIAAPVAMGVLSGTLLGTRLMTRLRSEGLRLIFAIVLIVVALEMLGKGLGLGIG
ncbi:MAG: sulfite exporter TauE/SafE family protein [Dehalococcoidia bacterium]